MRAGVASPRPAETRPLQRSIPVVPSASAGGATNSVWRTVQADTTAHSQRCFDRPFDYFLRPDLEDKRRSLLGLLLPEDHHRVAWADRAASGEWWELTASVGSVGVRRRRDDGSQKLQPIRPVEEPEPLEVPEYGTLDDARVEAAWPQREAGIIRGFSGRSRVRMLRKMAAVDWVNVPGIPEMVTLTYPRVFPDNGPECKAHLAAFIERHRRRWGSVRGSWKMEFQRRGAPHFHLYIFRPSMVPIREYMAWVARAWYEVVGSGDPLHLQAGTSVDRQFCSKVRSSRMIAWYFAKHQLKGDHGKKYQNEVPEGFRLPGRFWGILGLEAREDSVAVTADFARDLMRALRRYRRAQTSGARRLRLSSERSLWALVNRPDVFLAKMLDAAEPPAVVYVHWSGEADRVRCWPPGQPRPLP